MAHPIGLLLTWARERFRAALERNWQRSESLR
jgi:hypothetical protein